MMRGGGNHNQLGFTFEPPVVATAAADLAGLDKQIAATVALALKEETRDRREVAGAMSALLDDDVSKAMLDAYASESRDNYNISAGRFLALIAATHRFDLLDRVARRIGATVLVGEEIMLADLADLDCRIEEMKKRRKVIATMVQPIARKSPR